MNSFPEFEAAFIPSLQQERSDLQGLQGASEAQLSAWVQPLFQQYLGYSHWKEITREASTPIGSKGSKQLFPDLRINVLDNGVIFVECKRSGRLEGPKGQDELNDAVSQLRAYIRAYVDQASVKPKTVLGIVTDGNRWLLMGLNRTNEFHTVAEWAFLTDDPKLLAQRLWLLAKPALAQPTSALVEFLARRTLLDVLKENTRWLTKKVNEKLPEGAVSEDSIGKWLRDAFSDPVSTRLMPVEAPSIKDSQRQEPLLEVTGPIAIPPPIEPAGRRVTLSDLLGAGLLVPQDILFIEVDGRKQTASISPDGSVDVAGTVFESVSPAALRVLELAGKARRAVNGWAAFRVQRGGQDIGSLIELRAQYEDRQQVESPTAEAQGPEAPAEVDNNPAVTLAAEQLKPLLGLLPELMVNPSKSGISLYAGKLVVAYAYPRKKGMPKLRVYVGETFPDWTTPDPTYAFWCYVDDWIANIPRVVNLLKAAPRCRAEDLAAGKDAYARREDPGRGTLTFAAQ
ncbi:MAG TPA: hypothetical protein VK395_32715 [Gemmataceae bacterium]|nr:hypothetical protein [Gemmataceae bacterium]